MSRDVQARMEITVAPEDVQRAAKPKRRSFFAEYRRLIVREAGARATPRTSAKPRGFTPGTGVWQGRWASHQC